MFLCWLRSIYERDASQSIHLFVGIDGDLKLILYSTHEKHYSSPGNIQGRYLMLFFPKIAEFMRFKQCFNYKYFFSYDFAAILHSKCSDMLNKTVPMQGNYQETARCVVFQCCDGFRLVFWLSKTLKCGTLSPIEPKWSEL